MRSSTAANRTWRMIAIAALLCVAQWCPSIRSFSAAPSSLKTTKRNSIPTFAELQKCVTIQDMLQRIAARLPCGTSSHDKREILMLSSTLLVRLSKQAVGWDNEERFALLGGGNTTGRTTSSLREECSWDSLNQVVKALVSSNDSWDSSPSTVEAVVEATKAAAILSRLLNIDGDARVALGPPLIQQWQRISSTVAEDLLPHQLSGMKWAVDCFQLVGQNVFLPDELQQAHDALQLPFCIRPGAMNVIPDLTVPNLLQQVDFQMDTIRTPSNKLVPERRQTAWEGDEHVAPFEYSGKRMPRQSWSSLVRKVRDTLQEQMGTYYDGCLLNHYPDGGSGMRYHIDPDQGTVWDYSTTVVSVGATRKFAFRESLSTFSDSLSSSSSSLKPHVFTLMEGDCTEMFGDCQSRFQHTVRTAEMPHEQAARASLVFKKTLL